MKIRITESQLSSIKKHLTEVREHTDDEIVDFNGIDLQGEFNKLNNLLFDGKLQPVQMIWNKRKAAHGVVKATMNRATRAITIKSLAMSQFLKIPYKFFKDVLAHEMIHVYLLQKGINDKHGPYFHAEMYRINKMGLGFNVTVRGDSAHFEMSDHMVKKGLELVAGIFHLNGKIALAVMKPNTYTNEAKGIGNIYKHTCKTGKYREVTGEFYMTTDPQLQRGTIQRSFRSGVSYSWIDEVRYNEIKSNGEHLSTFIANADEVIWNGPQIPSEVAPKPQKQRRSKYGGYNFGGFNF